MLKIKSIKSVGLQPCCDIAVEYPHCYYNKGVLTHNSGEPIWVNTFLSGGDIHTATAKAIWGENAGKNERKKAKVANFGLLYGGNEFTLHQKLNVPLDEAKKFISDYFKALPTLSRWREYQQNKCMRNDVLTYFGRPRRMARYFMNAQDWKYKAFGKRTALNSPVQGCLQKHTRILTDRGYLKIEELLKLDYSNWNVWTGKRWAKFQILNRGKAQLSDLYLRDGHILPCDIRHEVRCHTMTKGNSKFYEVKNLIKGKRVCTIKPIELEFVDQFYPRAFKEGKKPGNYKDVIFPEDLSETYYWLGRYMGDGFSRYQKCRKDLTILFGLHERQYAYKFEKYIKSLGIEYFTRAQRTGKGSIVISVQINSAGFVDYLYQVLGLEKGVARTKKIPKSLWSAKLCYRKEFINGFVDSDGCKKWKSLHLMNDFILRELQLLWEITYKSNIRVQGPFSCGSSSLTWNNRDQNVNFCDDFYGSGVFKKLIVKEVYEDTFTLSVFDDDHQFVSHGVISKNTGGDVIRLSLIRVVEYIYKNSVEWFRVLSTVHDEMNFSVKDDHVHQFMNSIPDLMTVTMPEWKVPLEVDVSAGDNWNKIIPYIYDKENKIFTPNGTHFKR